MKAARLPGFVSYAAIGLWFLLTIAAPLSARAADAAMVTLTPPDLAPTIEAALAEKGLVDISHLEFENPALAIEAIVGETPVFESVSVNPASGRFLIRARANAETRPAAIAGRAVVMRRMPVLAVAIDRGAVIAESDIAYAERSDVVAGAIINDAADLIGMEARRPLPAGAPIRKTDVKAPVLVKRGAVVNVIYEQGGVRLSMQGVASAAGGAGDVVSIENTASNRAVKAIVTGQNRARVLAPNAL
ncbi:MAG: flagellar basal body P-ring formation chaperone FlgA [Pseudomonadota bacterium]